MVNSKKTSKVLRNAALVVCSLLLSVGSIFAQDLTVTGTVTDSKGEPIVGGYVLLQGTSTGASTDIDGKYSINVASNATLVFTSMGYKDQIIPVAGRAVINVQMEEDALFLEDAVVTAMGIKKERKALGYAVQDLKGDEIIKNKTSNVLNAMAGKVAGVNVTQSGGAAGAGASIIIRGGTSLERDNQPLFVVDGIIYDNSTAINGGSGFDGAQNINSTYSNRIMDINPEDVESMSILKGPAAAALYGSKAAAGVVLITTKKGQEGIVQVNISSKYSNNWVNRLPEQQSTYTRGFYNEVGDLVEGEETTTMGSWGDKFKAGESMYNNIADFFQRSNVFDNNISVSGGTKTNSFFISASRFDQSGIIPGTNYNKTTFRFNGDQKIGKIFTIGANVAYSIADQQKALTSGGLYNSGGVGAMNSTYLWPRDENMSHWLNEDGTKYRMFPTQLVSADYDNPYWIANKQPTNETVNRFTGSLNMKLDIADWFYISYTAGTDRYTTDTRRLIAPGSGVKIEWEDGMLSENERTYEYYSSNLMLNFNKKFGDFELNLLVGNMIEATNTKYNGRMGWKFIVPEFYSINNVTNENMSISQNKSQKRMVGVYGEFRASYKNIAYVTVTGRNDWTSTLPTENNSYFYPSVSGSLVFSEFIPKNDVFSFGKIRASWAEVGKDASPYVTNTYVNSPHFTILGQGIRNSWTNGNPYLLPEKTRSLELGLEMKFFEGRLGFDYTYYSNNSYNQLLSPRTSQATGYIFMTTNAGDITNRGMELAITAIPVTTRDFTWDMTLNMAGNRGTVNNLLDGLDILYVTDVQVGNAKAASFNGGNFMAISGSKYSRTDDGDMILNAETGMPTYDGLVTHEIGNREPTLYGGFNNSFQYKGFNLSFLLDYRIGGDVYNGTEYYMTNNGMSLRSEGRDELVLNGVVRTGGTDEEPIYEPKTFTYNAGQMYDYGGKQQSGESIIQEYYNTYLPYESSEYMTDVNWLRLRNVSLSYDFTDLIKNQNVLKGLRLTLTGTNLWLWTNYAGMDPETSAAGSGVVGSSSVGIDYCGVPSTAGFSVGLNLTF